MSQNAESHAAQRVQRDSKRDTLLSLCPAISTIHYLGHPEHLGRLHQSCGNCQGSI